MQALVVDLLHVRHRHALQQRHTLAQAFLGVGDFTAHGGFGDGRDLCFAARGVGDLVHALDVDQRRVHVEGDQLEVMQMKWGREATHREAGTDF